MPRVAGVSFSSTVWRMRRRPRPRTVVACFRSNPIGLFTSVTLTVAPFVSVRWLAMALCARARERLQFLSAKPRDRHRILQRREAGERGAHDVVRVRRSERLREDVGDAGRLHDGADGAAGDDAGAVGRRFQQHAPRSEAAGDRVRNRRSLQRHADEILLRRLDTFLDRRWHFLRLADAEADDAVAVADDDERAEAQVLAALDDLGDPVDRDDGVLDVELRGIDPFTSAHYLPSRGAPPPLADAWPATLETRRGRAWPQAHQNSNPAFRAASATARMRP